MPVVTRLPRVLGPVQAFAVVVGGVIGASFFLVPSIVASRVPSISSVILVWVLGALVSLSGALTFSELAAMLPEAGGGYVYIRTALGPFAAFLFGWTDALLIRAGAAAAISFTFAIYFAELVPAPAAMPLPVWQGLLGVAVIAILTATNLRGTRIGANVQVTGTVIKMIAVGAAAVLPVLLWRGANSLYSAPTAPHPEVLAALTPILWTYTGWDQLTHLAEEVKDPGRNLPRILAGGILTVATLYLGAVLGIHYVLPYGVVAKSNAVGADLFRALLGPAGATIISVMIMISAVITANGALLAAPRPVFAMARDGYGPRWISRVHPRFQTPANAILLTGLWSALLIAISVPLMQAKQKPLFEVLLSYVMFGYLGFQCLVVVSAFVLRKKMPLANRPYRIPLYPWLPAMSFLATAFLMVTTVVSNPTECAVGVAIVATGIPVWWFYRSGAATLTSARK